ncbi:MAG: STAS domain-containing protein [Thermomicrobiales bacterium]|nr:STAS domain-containing protein [Thermomicrobiales bacterium]
MQISVTDYADDISVVALNGRLDLLSAASVKNRLKQEVERGRRRLVIDLDAVPMIDSSGLGALVGGLKATRIAGGDLRLARTPEQARTILRLTMLDRVLASYGSVDEAIAAYA